MYLNN